MEPNEQLSVFADNPEYEAFVNKFKPKLTTDDCYTLPEIFKTISDWACEEYGIDRDRIVRPFYPGGDYEHFPYPEGCVVLDNPPFSILSKICEFYLERGIPFFLFAPALTSLSGRNVVMRMNHILCDAKIVYENGAIVQTGFVTSFGGDIIIQTSPELHRRIADTMRKMKQAKSKTLPKYEYPDHIMTAARMNRYAKYGIDLKIHRSDCVAISALDAQREQKKGIFGGGLLLSDRAAAMCAAAGSHANAQALSDSETIRWTLSQRELEIVKKLGGSAT